MKKLLFFVATAALVLFSSISVFGETYIGTMSNKTYNAKAEAPCVLLLDDNQTKGTLYVGYPIGLANSFSAQKTGNKLTFKAGNIEYNLTISNEGMIGEYNGSILDNGIYKSQKGTCQFTDITGKSQKMYAESISAIIFEAANNNNKQGLQDLFYYFHPTGEARYLKVEKTNATYDGDKLLKLKHTCSLYWQGPMQSGQTLFSIEYDATLNRYSTPELIKTSGFTNEDAKAAIGGAALLIDALLSE